LTPSNQVFVGFLSVVTALLTLNWKVQSGRYYHPIAVLMLGALIGSLLIEPFLFAAIFLEFSAIGAVVLIATGRSIPSRGAMRILTFYTLSTIAILTTGWLLENAAVTSETPELVRRVTILIGIGFAILMAVPPLHAWLPSAAERTQPVAIILILILLQSSGLFFLYRFLDTYAWLREDPLLVRGIQVMGSVMVLSGGILALSVESRNRAFLYAVLTDFGVSLIAISTQTSEGYFIALAATGVRVIVLGMWAFATHLQEEVETTLGKINPMAIMTISASWLALSGFPLTPGFPLRVYVIQLLIKIDIRLAAIVTVGSICILLAFFPLLRGVRDGTLQAVASLRKDAGIQLPVVIGLVAFLIVSLFPHLLWYWVPPALEGLPNLLP
jgi:NADH-quinone oxidoreductase subunit M